MNTEMNNQQSIQSQCYLEYFFENHLKQPRQLFYDDKDNNTGNHQPLRQCLATVNLGELSTCQYNDRVNVQILILNTGELDVANASTRVLLQTQFPGGQLCKLTQALVVYTDSCGNPLMYYFAKTQTIVIVTCYLSRL